jgi:hypothetical protein
MPYIGQGLTEGRRRLHNFVATSNQTTFIATYDVGYIDVYQNGILLTSTDYTATNGTTVVLAVGASSGDEITIIAHQIFSVTDTVSAITGGAFGGNVDVTGNITTTGSLRGPSTFTIDPAVHGANSGTVVIAGDLQVDGTTTTINSTTLDIDDKNIVLASGSANSSAAGNAGITIDLGSDGTATMLYTHATTSLDFNKPVNIAGNLGVTGTVDGVDIQTLNTTAGAALPKAGGAMTGAITTNSTFDGVDIATRDAVLTSTTNTANAALPKAGGAMTGDLTITSNADSADGNLKVTTNTPSNYPAIVIQTSTGGNSTETHGLHIKNTAAGHGLRIDDEASDTSPFVVTSEGKVGIGTENPAFKLQVYGIGNTAQVRIKGSNNSQYDFYAYSDNNFYINNTNGTILGLLENKDAYFGKNLGIGDSVLSTYHTSYPALELGSSASVQGYTGANGVWLQSNLFMNTNGQWTSKSNDYSAMLELYDGNFNFYNTASGTGTRTLLTPMTIRQSGNVGIGTTAPSSPLFIRQNTSDAYTATSFNNASTLTLQHNNADTNYAGIRFTNSVGNYEHFLGSVQTSANTADMVFQGYDRGAGAYKEYLRITDSGAVVIPNTSANNVNNESHVLIRNLANGEIVTDNGILINPAEDKVTLGGGTFVTSGYIRSGIADMQFGTASQGVVLKIKDGDGAVETLGNTFHIHAGQGSLGHGNEFQFLTTEVATGSSGSWYDVCYVSHSPNLRFHGMSVQSNNPALGGARYMGALMGTYGSVACYQEQKRVTAMNGGGVSDIDYRYLNSGASSGSYRLQVKLNFSGSDHRVYTCVYGNATAEISKDGY